MKILRRVACGVFALGIALSLAVPARSDVPLVSYKSLYTGSGTRTGPVIVLAGQNTCTVTTSGGASGYTVTVKGSSVGSGTLTTLTQFGSSGAITTDSANAGNLTGTVVALTNFTYVVTGTITGTLTVVETCSAAGSSPVSGTVSGTVAVSNFPTPFPTSSPGGAQIVVPANASAIPYISINPTNGPYQGVVIGDGTTGSGKAPVAFPPNGSASANGLYTHAFLHAYNAGTNVTYIVSQDGYNGGPLWMTTGGSATSAAVTAGKNTVTVIKGTPGRLAKILVTTLGTAELDCYDNATAASGTIIGIVAASAAAGTVSTFDMPASAGITCSASANNPAVTISYY